jgi:hypothetical protein
MILTRRHVCNGEMCLCLCMGKAGLEVELWRSRPCVARLDWLGILVSRTNVEEAVGS